MRPILASEIWVFAPADVEDLRKVGRGLGKSTVADATAIPPPVRANEVEVTRFMPRDVFDDEQMERPMSFQHRPLSQQIPEVLRFVGDAPQGAAQLALPTNVDTTPEETPFALADAQYLGELVAPKNLLL